MGIDTFKKVGTWMKIIAAICFILACVMVTRHNITVTDHYRTENNFQLLAAGAAIPVFILLVILRIAGKAASPPLEAGCDLAWFFYSVVCVFIALLGTADGGYGYGGYGPGGYGPGGYGPGGYGPGWYGPDGYYYNGYKNDRSDEWVIKIATAAFFGVAALVLIVDALMMLKSKKTSSGGDGD